MPKAVSGAARRFMEDVLASEASESCILWPFAKRNGYGALGSPDRKTQYAHRMVCERAHGPRSEHLDVAHSCGNRACVNPAHLRWATRKDNLADTLRHGTRAQGVRHGMARLTEDQVRTIMRNEENLGSTEWGRRLNIAPSAINAIWSGRRWKHLFKETSNA